MIRILNLTQNMKLYTITMYFMQLSIFLEPIVVLSFRMSDDGQKMRMIYSLAIIGDPEAISSSGQSPDKDCHCYWSVIFEE